MDNPKPDREQRRWCRFKIYGPRQQCELKVGDRLWQVRLLDESTGGFAIMVDPAAGLSVGDRANLGTTSGWCIVEVTHITEVQTGGGHPLCRVGLRRLDDLICQPKTSSMAWFDSLRYNLASQGPAGGMLAASSILLLVILFGLPAGYAISNWYGDGLKVRTSENTLPSRKPLKAGGSFHQSPSATVGRTNFWNSSDRETPASVNSPVSTTDSRSSLARLPGASVFAAPEVVELLRLTAAQQSQINSLIAATTEAIRNLDRQMPGADRQQLSQHRKRLLDDARQNALELLTDEQRDRWREYSGNSR